VVASREIAPKEESGRAVEGSHFDLLNHPQVYEHLREWLEPKL